MQLGSVDEGNSESFEGKLVSDKKKFKMKSNQRRFTRSFSIPAGLRWHSTAYALHLSQLKPELAANNENKFSKFIGLKNLSKSCHQVLKQNRNYFESLLGSGEGTLINLIIHYHETLVRNGFKKEADVIIKEFESYLKTIEQYKLLLTPELKGMNLLLKDGLLHFLLTINPYLPKIPSQVVKFRNVTYEVDVEITKNRAQNFLTAGWNLLKSFVYNPKHSKLKVLNNVTGYMMPGSMTLVFGPSGCGKSTLQKILSGHAKATGGKISYNGQPQSKVNIHRIAGVGFESNLHHSMLKVSEILSYARSFSNAFDIEESKKIEGLRNILSQALVQEEDPILEIRLRLLGLKNNENSASESVSMDERIRLTVAEIMVGAYALLFFDHISPGYSGKSTYEIIDMIRIFARVRQLSVLISLRLPTQEVFELFDRIILLNRGRVVYQGPTRDAVLYFESIGYKKPSCFSDCEFLQEVTTEKGKKFLIPGFESLDIEGFVSKYESSFHYNDILRIVNDPNYKHEFWIDTSLPFKDFKLQKYPINLNEYENSKLNHNDEFPKHKEIKISNFELNEFKPSFESSSDKSIINSLQKNENHSNDAYSLKNKENEHHDVIINLDGLNSNEPMHSFNQSSAFNVHNDDNVASNDNGNGDGSCIDAVDGNGNKSALVAVVNESQDESSQTLTSTSIVRNDDYVTGFALPNGEMRYLKKFGGNLSTETVYPYIENAEKKQKHKASTINGNDYDEDEEEDGGGGGDNDGDDEIDNKVNEERKPLIQNRNQIEMQKMKKFMKHSESRKLMEAASFSYDDDGTVRDSDDDDDDDDDDDNNFRFQMERNHKPVMDGLYKEQFESKYVLNFKKEFCILFKRQNQIMFRNKFLLYARLIQVIVMSIFNATNLSQMSKKYTVLDMNLRRSIGFTSLVTMMLSNLGQLPFFLEEKNIYYKHAKAKFFRPLNFLLVHFLSGLPYSLAEGTIWSILVYFITGLSLDEGKHFFIFLLVHLLLIVNGASMVRFIAFSCSNPSVANLISSVSMPVFLLFAHFLISFNKIPPYWKWIYIINPMQWCSNMIMTNEFKSKTYDAPCSQNPQLQFCKNYPNDSIGLAYLKIYNWNYHDYIFYVGPLVILSWIFLWNFMTYWFLRPRYFSRLSVGQKTYNVGTVMYKIDDYGGLEEIVERKEDDDMEKVDSVVDLRELEKKKKQNDEINGVMKDDFLDTDTASDDNKVENHDDDDDDDIENGIVNREIKEIEMNSSRDDPSKVIKKSNEIMNISKNNSKSMNHISNLPDASRRVNTEPEDSVTGHEKRQNNLGKCVLPCRPVVLTWQSLSYEINRHGNTGGRLVLSGISGWAKPGEVFAILGANNSGKTTLLDCLVGRKLPGKVEGQILVNGHVRNPATWIHAIGYVERMELYPPYLTLKENLTYRAAMNLPAKIKKSQRIKMVEEVMECVKIGHLANYLVGELSQSLEMEKIKRIGIALELSANPSVLFLDSPLESLDVKQAKDLANCLQNVASKMDRTVILTSTYPSASCLSSFSSVMFLKRGGEMIYFGDSGHFGSDILSYFQSIPGTPPPPPNMTPVTYVYNLVGDGIHGRGGVLRDYAFEYRVSELALRNAYHLASIRNGQLSKSFDYYDQSAPSLPVHVSVPYHRRAKEVFFNLQKLYWRNTNYTFNRLLYAVIMSTILGSIYYQIDPTTFTGMNTRAAFVFATVVFGGTVNASTAVSIIAQLKSVLAHEREVKQFPSLLYVIAYTFAEIPYMAFSTLIFVSISANMANVAVNSVSNFFLFWLTFFLMSLAITYLGLLLAIIFPRPQIASVIIPMIIGAWITTGGYILPRVKIKEFYTWVFWTNPLQYALNTMTVIAFYCDTMSSDCAIAGCSTNPSMCPNCHCPRLHNYGNLFVWDTLKAQRTLERFRIGYDLLFLAMFCVLCRMLTYIARRTLRNAKR